MRHHRTQAGSDEHRRLERAIVLTLLAEDHDERWPREELAGSLRVDRAGLDAALERLHADGVLGVLPTHMLNTADGCSPTGG